MVELLEDSYEQDLSLKDQHGCQVLHASLFLLWDSLDEAFQPFLVLVLRSHVRSFVPLEVQVKAHGPSS